MFIARTSATAHASRSTKRFSARSMLMEDDIVILEEDAPSVGVREIEAPLDFRRKVAAAAVPVVAPPPVPEPPKPVLHAGFEVYAHGNGALYWKREGGAPNLMAHNEYPFFNSHKTIHAKTASM